VLVSQLNQQDRSNVNGTLDFEVSRAAEPAIRAVLEGPAGAGGIGNIFSRNATRSSDTENTIDSKIRIQVKLVDIDRIPPRETQSAAVAVKDDVKTAFA